MRVFTRPAPGGVARPAIDPSGKVVSAMLRPATLILVAVTRRTVNARAFWAPFPGPAGNPVLDLVAYHDPGFHAVIRVWYYASPAVAVVLAGSLGLSVWRVSNRSRGSGAGAGCRCGPARRKTTRPRS